MKILVNPLKVSYIANYHMVVMAIKGLISSMYVITEYMYTVSDDWLSILAMDLLCFVIFEHNGASDKTMSPNLMFYILLTLIPT